MIAVGPPDGPHVKIPAAYTITVTGGNDRLRYLSTGDVLDRIIGFDNDPAGGGQDVVCRAGRSTGRLPPRACPDGG